MESGMATRRDRSPLRYPAAANIGISPALNSTSTFDNTTSTNSTSFDQNYNSNIASSNSFNSTFAAQPAFDDSSFPQDLSSLHSISQQQQLGAIDNTTSDPVFDSFQSSAQHYNLKSSNYPTALDTNRPRFGHTHSTSSSSILSHPTLSNGTTPPASDLGNNFESIDFDPNSLDPTLINELDLLQEQSSNNNTTAIDNTTNTSLGSVSAAMPSHSPTPPHLLSMMRPNSGSPSPRSTPALQQQSPPPPAFTGITRPRNVSDSLNPSSAAYLQAHGGSEWAQMAGYRTHRRAASDNFSDISSHSNHASPYLGSTLEGLDIAGSHNSPMINPIADQAFTDALGIDQFTISDHPASRAASFISPAHSPHVSPRLLPQQQQRLPPFTADNNFGLSQSAAGPGQINAPTNGYDIYNNSNHEAFLAQSDIGQDRLSPPAITIDCAEPTRPMDIVAPSSMTGDLVPPTRRNRAKSDSYAGRRTSSAGFGHRGRSPSLHQNVLSDSLFPAGDNPASRSNSPRGRNGTIGNHARTTSAASDQREYILDLANPERSPSNSGDNRRSQKHPATFQCHLCPKRFTRAYNLRSHLRTHTDERPFVCTVCNKAFARQHDRKRHEGLHSGEKKFVCKGPLQSGGTWGCNRRFARADALGRHFRSEAGRVCIKPLLDEEAAEQEQVWRFEQQQAQAAAGFGGPAPQMQQTFFPQALLQQYPEIARIDWSNAQASAPQDEDYVGGRSSFDASSGGEMYEEFSENELSSHQLNMNFADNKQMNAQQMSAQQMNAEPVQQHDSFGNQNPAGAINFNGLDQNFALGGMQQQQPNQQQQQMNVYGNHQMADFTSNMEGR